MVSSPALTCQLCGTSNAPGSSLCVRCQHPLLLSAYLASQALFHEHYHLIEKLGAGGFASVYKARDTRRGQALVALKEISVSDLAPQAVHEAIDAFHREVEVLSQLAHPSLPHVYECIDRHEQCYLVLDFIEGETLEAYQNKAARKRLPLSEVFSIGLQLCAVLEYLHTRQPPIIFRDLKPANIIRSPQGKLFVIDFGIARFFKPGQSKDTRPLGSPGYAAPEQYGRLQTTPRADIYSLGAVLHQLLTGRDASEVPLRLASLIGLRTANRVDPASLTSSMVDVMMQKLGLLIDSMLELDVRKRPASVTLVKQELQILAEMWSEIVKDYIRPRVPERPATL